jgi:prevent-host-death family protein
MTVFNTHEAKTRLSELIARVEAGEEIVIARHNVPVAKIVAVKAEALPKRRKPRAPGALAHLVTGPHAFDPFEHAPDDHISKEDIAAYYRKYPHEWSDMRQRVGFAQEGQAQYDLTGLREAVAAGKEYTIMQDGKPVAKVAPLEPEQKPRGWGAWEGRYRLPDSFFDPLPEEELRAWEGSDEPSA